MGDVYMNYYEILEISEKASQEVIHMAYKALCKKYHPDVYQGNKKFAEEQIKKINEAYVVLSDPLKRKAYDDSLNSKNYYEQPKKEKMDSPVITLLKRGFMALEDGDWIKADTFFEHCLNLDAELAEAYLRAPGKSKMSRCFKNGCSSAMAEGNTKYNSAVNALKNDFFIVI